MQYKVIENTVLMIFFIIVSLIVELPFLFLTSFIYNFEILAIYLTIIISILTILVIYLISNFTF
jgi:hypothetical protein